MGQTYYNYDEQKNGPYPHFAFIIILTNENR